MGRGARGRRRGRNKSKAARSSRSKASSSSKSKSKSKSKRTSASASRKRARSVSKAARNRRTTTKSTTSTKKKTKKPSMGRSRHTPGGQHAANKNQNKKAKRTVRSVRKAVSKVAGNVGKAVKKATKGLAAKAGTHVANSKYNKQLKQANWTKRDMSKLTPQQQRKYQRLSEKTGRDYSMRRPTFRLNLNADTLARFGGFADSGWYKGVTNRFPGIKKLKINKQFYGNPMKKGWHSSQRTGRGQGLPSVAASLLAGQQAAQAAQAQARQQNEAVERQNAYDVRQWAMRKPRRVPDTLVKPPSRSIRGPIRPRLETPMGPQQDWLGDLYSSHNINQGKLDQAARDYWSNEAKTKGRDAVMKSIIGTSKAQGTYGGRKVPMPINTGSSHTINTGSKPKRRGGGGHWATIGATVAGQVLGRGSGPKTRRPRKGLSQNQVRSLVASTPRFF